MSPRVVQGLAVIRSVPSAHPRFVVCSCVRWYPPGHSCSVCPVAPAWGK